MLSHLSSSPLDRIVPGADRLETPDEDHRREPFSGEPRSNGPLARRTPGRYPGDCTDFSMTGPRPRPRVIRSRAIGPHASSAQAAHPIRMSPCE